tara:strand:+ start:6541 stop:7131 length:591 start_codon:yes stop_codon:yes gene_type:complete
VSLEAITWAFRQQLSPSEKLVLLTLADYADDEDKCWPKQTTLADRTGLTRQTVALKLKSLEEMSFIKRIPRKHTSDLIFIHCTIPACYKIELSKNNVKPQTKTATRKARTFQPPTIEAVREYAKSVGAESQADQFHEYFTVGNWKDSRGVAVKNWKQKFLTWKSFNEKRGATGARNSGQIAAASEYGAAAVKAGNN